MKIMVASDIHGSAYYCEKMISAYKAERAERLLLLGDLLYHGPRNDLPKGYDPKKVTDMLNSIKEDILAVRGNCEAEVDQMVLDFPVLADYAFLSIGNVTLFATHGHIYNEQKLPPLKKGNVLLNGHTHVPKCTVHGDYVYMNPGSVSIPKENSAHQYMTFDGAAFLWKSLDGDILNKFSI